jgi:hypothetical protein
MSSFNQDRDFRDALIPNNLLEEAIAWIAKNMSPDYVFDEKTLDAWASDNGYVIPEE